MAFLKPDKVLSVKVGNSTIKINVKITPDGARAEKNIASWVLKGELVKPNKKLNNGTGKPKGITIHNTNDIKAQSGTNPAEQYARATYPNGNMNGAAVHYWVWKNEIWQQLDDSERGWHAGDGSSRRKDHRGGMTGGNIDTISIECIESKSDPVSEDTLAKLVAYLCKKHGLDPMKDVYTHNYWMFGKDETVKGAWKNCPLYILNHFPAFLKKVSEYFGKHTSASESSDKKVVTDINVGDKVKVKNGAYTYDGKKKLASFVYNRVHDVKEIRGDRVVITYRNVVVAAVKLSDLTKA